jgi:hypothetical protein
MRKLKLASLLKMQRAMRQNNIWLKTLANMPSITTATREVTSFPFKYITPFKNDAVVPLYSSIPLFNPEKGCLPCAACGNYSDRKKSLHNRQTDLKIIFLTKLQAIMQKLDLINKYENPNRLSACS